MNLCVCGFRVAKRIKRDGFTAVMTLEDPNASRNHRLRFHGRPAPEHLVLRFEDQEGDIDSLGAPAEKHVLSILDFGRRRRSGNLLIHCFHGVGRSVRLHSSC